MEKPIFDFEVKKHIQYLPQTFVTESRNKKIKTVS